MYMLNLFHTVAKCSLKASLANSLYKYLDRNSSQSGGQTGRRLFSNSLVNASQGVATCPPNTNYTYNFSHKIKNKKK